MTQPKKSRGRPNILGVDKGIGPLEAKIMRAIAGLDSPVTVREVCDALAQKGYFAYQGVLNCMNRLTQKRILARSKSGNAFIYRALVDVEELSAQVVINVLGHMGGQLDRVICRVLDIDPDDGAAQIAELRRKAKALSQK